MPIVSVARAAAEPALNQGIDPTVSNLKGQPGSHAELCRCHRLVRQLRTQKLEEHIPGRISQEVRRKISGSQAPQMENQFNRGKQVRLGPTACRSFCKCIRNPAGIIARSQTARARGAVWVLCHAAPSRSSGPGTCIS